MNAFAANPFTPSFGSVPEIVAGRTDLLATMRRAFENGIGDPNLATILVGARGTGKTALLALIASSAQESGWIATSSSALPGMLDDLAECAAREASHLVSSPGKRVAGVDFAQIIGISWDNPQPTRENWRSRMTRLLDALQESDTGLLITVDEVKPELAEMKTLVSVYQHFVREGRKVALCMAGLPYRVSSLLSDEDVSFLRRARRQTLGRISDAEISVALRRTIAHAGGTVNREAIKTATAAIGGFPYMMQLVGYWMWETACAEATQSVSITQEDAQRGIELASDDLRESVLDITWNELSPVDRKFIAAMIGRDGDVPLADIASAMGVKSNYATKYKKRLLEQGIIGEYGRNMLRFEIPGSRDYFAQRLVED